ncbi:MAG: DUF192 domain-containing protein [Spirochaetota bacterium]
MIRCRALGRTRSLGAIVVAALSLLVACDASGERYTLEANGVELTVEVADTPETRTRGLMERTELGEREGMLFVFESSEQRSFWMKNTPLPLSIAYIDDALTIREIHDMQPLSLEPVRSRHPARYALELNQGAFERLGIRVGDRLVPSRRLLERLDR